jgi:hypothetical protein
MLVSSDAEGLDLQFLRAQDRHAAQVRSSHLPEKHPPWKKTRPAPRPGGNVRAGPPVAPPSDPRASPDHPTKKSVLLHLDLTPYFYNWPVRIWPICRPEGGAWRLAGCPRWSFYRVASFQPARSPPTPEMYWNARLNAAGKQYGFWNSGPQHGARPAGGRRARWAVPCGYGHWGSKQSELNH